MTYWKREYIYDKIILKEQLRNYRNRLRRSIMKVFIAVLLVLCAIASYLVFQYHFIIINDGVQVLRKSEPSLKYTFVDGRGVVNKAKILANPTLVKAGVQNIFSGEGVTIRPKKQLEKGIDDLKD